ncbi:deaminase [Falsiroseomonas sp.]|uniref:deoxycytidylate deaminase n=1 Tax=Falsiroseomonas sp. TaxID=2870721 RepID=UPI002734AA27|nr:deaminase [Falsiroseomonas sp.]MDP3417901.1 deaminase [Falsiroseomonas sp.]
MTSRWDNHFLGLAAAHAAMSKDPNTKVGSVIVGPRRELRSAGFNGFPRLICDSPERLNDRETKLSLIVHAECNAIVQAARVGVPLDGCTLYLAATDDTGAIWGGPPCTRCTVHVIQAGITTVVSRPQKAVPSRWHADLAVARGLLAEAGVEYREVAHHG